MIFTKSAQSGGDIASVPLDAVLASDTLDFSALWQDLYFTIVEVPITDIVAWATDAGVSDLWTVLGDLLRTGTIVLVTGFNPFGDEESADYFDLLKILGMGKGQGKFDDPGDYNIAVAIGAENIIGGRGENTVFFYDRAEIPGRIEPGNGGSLTLDYTQYSKLINKTEGADVDLGASGIDFTITGDVWDFVPEWATEPVPRLGLPVRQGDRFGRR